MMQKPVLTARPSHTARASSPPQIHRARANLRRADNIRYPWSLCDATREATTLTGSHPQVVFGAQGPLSANCSRSRLTGLR